MPPDDLDRAIGQMIMTGFRGTELSLDDPLARQIRMVPPGFIVLFDYDVALQSPLYNIQNADQLSALTSAIQGISPEPILFATDQEGGEVARLSGERGFPESLTARALGARNDLELTRKLAEESARALEAAGIFLNLAPVVDLDLNPANPIIGGKARSYSADPGVVIAHAAEFIRAHHARGVLCTLKHFPGQGSATKDTHREFVDVSEEWQEVELEPFRRLIGMGLADAVMTAHLFDRKLDPEWPATLSTKTLSGILRGQLSFAGVVITDDLQMRAISSQYSLELTLRKAIEAGADVLSFANNTPEADPEIVPRVVATIRQMVRQGEVGEERIYESAGRIRRLKEERTRPGGAGPSTAGLSGELAEYWREFRNIQSEAEALLSGLSEEQLNWQPGRNSWSIGECLDHLVVIGSLLIPLLEQGMERGRKMGMLSRGPFSYSWPGRMFVESLRPTSRVRVRTVREYLPARAQGRDALLERFTKTQERYRRAVEEADGLDLALIKVQTPTNRLLRFSLGIWFAATLAHERRHLEQARRVRHHAEFPRRSSTDHAVSSS